MSDIHRMGTTVANHLRTDYLGKKHGGYNIYKDDKIKIVSDTYHSPNLDISIFIDGQETQVYSHGGGGHGRLMSHHPGIWEKYLSNELYPKALAAKEEKNNQKEAAMRQEHRENFSAIDDKKVFN